MKDQKTPEQLRKEITYYAGQIKRTKSVDRIQRAHQAIAKRERQLVIAILARSRSSSADGSSRQTKTAARIGAPDTASATSGSSS